jgi:hypothetical protein
MSPEVSRTNISSNQASSAFSGLAVVLADNLLFFECRIDSNYATACVALAGYYSSALLQCLVFHNNTYIDDFQQDNFRGLISLALQWTISDSVFSLNEIDYLIGNFDGSPGSLTFVNCSFDSQSFKAAAGGVQRRTNECVLGGNPSTLPPTCLKLPTATPPKTTTVTSNLAVTIGVLAGGVVGIGLLVAMCIWRRRKRNEKDSESEVTPEVPKPDGDAGTPISAFDNLNLNVISDTVWGKDKDVGAPTYSPQATPSVPGLHGPSIPPATPAYGGPPLSPYLPNFGQNPGGYGAPQIPAYPAQYGQNPAGYGAQQIPAYPGQVPPYQPPPGSLPRPGG